MLLLLLLLCYDCSSPLVENHSWLVCTGSMITRITHQPNGNLGKHYAASLNPSHSWHTEGRQFNVLLGFAYGWRDDDACLIFKWSHKTSRLESADSDWFSLHKSSLTHWHTVLFSIDWYMINKYIDTITYCASSHLIFYMLWQLCDLYLLSSCNILHTMAVLIWAGTLHEFWKVREKKNTNCIISWHFIFLHCQYLCAQTALDGRKNYKKTYLLRFLVMF